jgi:poly(hydroxyalkanoate) depolymerase family esterase
MARRSFRPVSKNPFQRVWGQMARAAVRQSTQAVAKALRPAMDKRKAPPGPGAWISGLAMGPGGARRYQLFKPPDVGFSDRLPLLVMLHGCSQDAKTFALSTRMNRLAIKERFLVLYPEQDRRAHPQGCWNWYDTRSGQAYNEAATLAAAIDQVCMFYPVDATRIAVAGLSAGASMAALLATRQPDRFKAVIMHSGVPPGMAHSTATALGAMRGGRPTITPLSPSAETGDTPWPPLLVIHGGADRVVSTHNAHAAAEVWARRAGGVPASQSRRVQRGSRHAMSVTDFKRQGRTLVSLCEVDALGHAWSGGDARHPFNDPLGPDASRMAWAFAARQFRTGP